MAVVDDSGPGSLRQAILDANATAGADQVAFAIPGDGVRTIRLASALPEVTDSLAIDGFTQPGSKPNDLLPGGDDARVLIELDGSAGFDGAGLDLTAGGSLARGLAIGGFRGAGIRVGGALMDGSFQGVGPAGVSIAGNRIGTDPTGTVARPNSVGILISRGSEIAIGGGPGFGNGNVISGNTGPGISAGSDYLAILNSGGSPQGLTIRGNRVGTDATGTSPLGNGGAGIQLLGVTGAIVGGGGEGNVISSNRGAGLDVEPSRSFGGGRGLFSFVVPANYRILGNAIGTDPGGTRPLGNGGDGIVLVAANGVAVGGPVPEVRNLIRANGGDGIRLGAVNLDISVYGYRQTYSASDLLIQGNAIGNGVAFGDPTNLGNRGVGVDLRGGARYSFGGGPITSGNAISGNRLPFLDAPLSTNYDGQARSNLAAYLPAFGAFAYRPTDSFGQDQVIPFGLPGPGQTVPTLGDYDGDGVADLAAYLPALGGYAYRPSAGGPDTLAPFGLPGPGQSIPAPGDYDGDGRTDVTVYLPALGAFGTRPSGGGFAAVDFIIPFGLPGPGQSIPAPGDYRGTGRDDLAVYLPSIGAFAIRDVLNGDAFIPFGIPGPGQTLPAPGDYDGDGKADLAAYLPAFGVFAYRPSSGGPDVVQAFGSPGSGAIPAPGDYTGSGKTEVALFVPAFGAFAYRPGLGGGDVIVAFGSAGAGASVPPATLPGVVGSSGLVAAQAIGPAPVPSTSRTSAAGLPGGPSAAVRKLSRPAVARDGQKPASWTG